MIQLFRQQDHAFSLHLELIAQALQHLQGLPRSARSVHIPEPALPGYTDSPSA